MSFVNWAPSIGVNYSSLLIYHRKKDLSEFLIDEDSNEDYSTTLNDFIFMLKRKLRLVSEI